MQAESRAIDSHCLISHVIELAVIWWMGPAWYYFAAGPYVMGIESGTYCVQSHKILFSINLQTKMIELELSLNFDDGRPESWPSPKENKYWPGGHYND